MLFRTTSTVLFFLATLLMLGALIMIFISHQYLVAAFMIISAFVNIADGMRLRMDEKK